MNKLAIALASAAAGFVLALTFARPAPVAAETDAKEIGRYQLQVGPEKNAFVVDTTTGQVLKWTYNREGKLDWLALTRPIK